MGACALTPPAPIPAQPIVVAPIPAQLIVVASKPFTFQDFSNDNDNDNSTLQFPNTIDESYSVVPDLPLLGTGRFASVCVAEDRLTCTRVAVKIIDKAYSTHKRRNVYSEVELMRACLPHPNILPVLDCFETPSKLMLVLKLAEMGDLFEVVSNQGALGNNKARQCITMLLSAVCHLHSMNILHRDIKPENILLDELGVVYLSDFGLAEWVDHTGDGDAVGSVPYSAPEVVRHEYGKPSDMWSVGCVAYVVLTGEHPFGQITIDNDHDQVQHLLTKITQCDYSLEHEAFTSCAPAQDFVSQLLVFNPPSRLCADKALAHRWLADGGAFSALGDEEGGNSDVRSSDLNTPSEPSSDEGDDTVANEFGNLGLGHIENEFLPIRIKNQGTDGGILVGCGGFHLVLATATGDVFVTGRNDENQLGVALTEEDEFEPKVTVPLLVDLPMQNATIAKICCGFGHTLLLTSSGRVLAFGSNGRGECGVGHVDPVVYQPTLVEFPSKRIQVIDLASKGFHSLVLTEDGGVLGFGSNDCYQLGLEHDEVVSRPTVVPLEHACRTIACGVYHSAVVDCNDVLWVFGDNSFAQLAQIDLEQHVPLPLDFPLVIDKVSCGFAHTVLLAEGEHGPQVWAYGSNANGQLGLGHFDQVVLFPTPIESLHSLPVSTIECGYNTTFFWVEEQGLLACGTNENGELGIGTGLPDQCLPARVVAVPISRNTPTVLASNFTVLLPPSSSTAFPPPSQARQSNLDSFSHLPAPSSSSSGGGGGGNSSSSNEATKTGEPLRNKRRHSNMGNHHYSHSLSGDLGRLLARASDDTVNRFMISDVTLQASADRGLFPVHKALINARCARLGKVIRAKLGSEATDSSPIVVLPKLTSDTLRRLLVFIYTSLVQISDASLSDILLLASCAQSLLAEDLFAACVLEIKTLLTDENVIVVLREACELNLLCVKRCCMEYIIDHFSQCVSSRNRQVVEILGNNPELLSEVVGLSSPDFANRLVRLLPASLVEEPSNASLERDMQALFESGEFADVCFQCQEENGDDDDFALVCHRVVLIARCPFFASSFQALYSLKEDGDAASVSAEDRKRVQLVFGYPDSSVGGTDGEGRVIVREINRSSPGALKCFLLYLYTDRIDSIKQDVAFDVLQMACIYGLGASPLAIECETMMKMHINASNAMDTLCIAKQLGRQELLQFALEYIVEHFVDCVSTSSEEVLRECLYDFPQLGVDLLMAVGARLRENKAESRLKKALQPQ
ncbi:hypothetical protein BASA81_012134 [Batrachochytrium salamandrivorans]|nr:hypothetical protein BASA81_012134 [Batrachochytrium salamandrivorans]